MATITTPANDAADLLQKLTLDSQTKTLDVHETPKEFGSINGLAKPYERSTVPAQDYHNLNMYYAPNGYASYYYGYDDPHNLWGDYRYVNHDGVDMHTGMPQRVPTPGIGQTPGMGQAPGMVQGPGMGQMTGFLGRTQLNDQIYGHYGNTYRGNSGFGLNYYNPKSAYPTWRTPANKYAPKGRSNGYFNFGNENKDNISELSKGPRSKEVNPQLGFGAVKFAVKGQDLPLKANNKEENGSVTSVNSEKEQYNKEDFPDSFSDAKFFVIKSYSEDDVHKSIKYNVWASTPNGNKKLDAAYQEAKAKADSCPVFLLFSVNCSGQFVGLAEMVGPVDFNKTMDFWQQDKWTGCFPVKWHLVKDVPNTHLKDVKLEYNENKPVTNSRDTQEVKLEDGIKVIKLFKVYDSKTSILDDFEFYEGRQRTLLEKKSKRQQFQKQMQAKKENVVADDKLLNSLDASTGFVQQPANGPVANGLPKSHQDLATKAATAADATKGGKAEKVGATDEVASAC